MASAIYYIGENMGLLAKIAQFAKICAFNGIGLKYEFIGAYIKLSGKNDELFVQLYNYLHKK